jgi:pimeloyl-ACP methyl ester carboxylesterase
MRQHLGHEAVAAAGPGRSAKAPRTAHRRAHLRPCHDAPGGLCGTVHVRLDRADPQGGKIPIFFEYYPHRDRGPTNEAILVTGGGPGSSITRLDDIFGHFFSKILFKPLLDERDLILVDQRGVGRSDAIDCGDLQHGSDDIYAAVAACGEQLGSSASLYSSDQVVRDIERVRSALGIDKLDFYGGSGAAEDIQAYAARFPQHLRSAVLDSPGTALGFNTFDPESVQAMKRTMRLVCARSRSCAAERGQGAEQLRWLVGRLQDQPVDGVGYDVAGDPHQVHVTESMLLNDILANDTGGQLVNDGEVGAAADALREGDAVPLLRLAAENDSDGSGVEDAGDPREYSMGDQYARSCADLPFPWDKSASIAMRTDQWEAARAALPPDIYAPFSLDAWLVDPDPCIAWPAPDREIPPQIPPGAELPGGVPALILGGDLDFNIPRPIALGVADAWPNSRFVEIANSGHQTAGSNRAFDCSDPMIVHFIAKLEPGDTSCAKDTQTVSVPAVGRFALTADDARPAGVDPGSGDQSTATDRKVATVATAAVTDALRRAFINCDSGVGLRGGTFDADCDFEHHILAIRLHHARFAEDVAVSGPAAYDVGPAQAIDGTVRVDGPGDEDGRLRVRGVWFGFGVPTTVLKVSGDLGGRSVALRVPAS